MIKSSSSGMSGMTVRACGLVSPAGLIVLILDCDPDKGSLPSRRVVPILVQKKRPVSERTKTYVLGIPSIPGSG
eukprot:COSAG02_NODE_983_length_15470_cov_4.269924_9_plen_74_part_00